MIEIILHSLKHLGSQLKQSIKQWTKPVTVMLVTGSFTDMTRSRADLIIENAMLRQQLIVLKRQDKQPQFTDRDRFRLVLLAGSYGLVRACASLMPQWRETIDTALAGQGGKSLW